MKKIYFALMAMLVSFCASAADYYLVGGFNGWSNPGTHKFTDMGDGTYEYTLNGTLTKDFKITNGTWADSGTYGGSGNLTPGVVYNLTQPGSNIGLAENIENPHLVFNPTAKTLLITGETVEAEYKYGIHGSLTSSSWVTTEMTEKDGKWVLDVDVTFNSAKFGIKQMDANSGAQTDWYSASGNSVINEAGTYGCKVNGTDFSIAIGKWSFSFDPESLELVVTGEASGDDPIPPTPTDYTGWYLNVQGDFNNWTPSGVAFNADGTVEATNLAIGDGEFELKIWDGTADSYWGNASAVIVPGEPVQVYKNGGHMTISDAAAGDVYNVSYNAATEMMTVTKVGGGEPVIVTKYYGIHGTIFGGEWQTINLEKNDDGNYELTAALVAGEFGVKIMNEAGNQTGWIGGGVTISEENVVYNLLSEPNATNELEGQYTIIFDPEANTLKFVPYQGEIEEVITYAIHGTIVNGGSDWVSYNLTEEDGKWVSELTVVPGTFGIKMMVNGVQEKWYASPTAEESTIDAIGTFTAGDLGTTNWTLNLTGEYKFVFDPEAMTLAVTYTSGVEAVEAAEAVEAVYYNLQGVRVANPANGLYIRVAGEKASKVYVK